MASSTSNIDKITTSQASKEVTANAYFDAASAAALYAYRESTSSGLTWGYYGGVVRVSGVATVIANGTIALTASASNYIEADSATGAVSKNTSGFTAGRIPLYTVVAGASTPTSWTDHRAFVIQAGYASANQAAITATAGASYTSAEQDMINALKTLVNEMRDTLIKAGLWKGGA